MQKYTQVVVLGLIRRSDGKYLFTLRDDGSSSSGKWNIPGGGLEWGESPEACLRRELREETGLEVRNIRLLPEIFSKSGPDWHRIFPVYVCESLEQDPIVRLDHEASDYRWITLDEAREFAGEILSGCIEALEAAEAQLPN